MHTTPISFAKPFNFHSSAEEVTEGIDLTGQYWLITGSNSGLGKETVRVLAMRGAQIIATARTEESAAHTLYELGIKGTPIACDLAELSSVHSAVQQIQAKDIQLHGIIANAGVMALPTLQQKNGIELQFYTNHIGHFALVTGLLDALHDRARVVILSSRAHAFAQERGLELDNLSGQTDYHPWRMYGRSKLANILFANALQTRFTGTQKTANSVHPGIIPTNLGRHIPNVEEHYKNIQQTMALKNIAQGASTQCLVAVRPELEGVGGYYFSDCQIATPIAQGTDNALAEELWNTTEEIIAEQS
jgi:NAD(P)-dependent dehydrogenase (short-subunit alcohol dehydrogenase family)